MSLHHQVVASIASLLVGLPVGAWAACNQIPAIDALRTHAIAEGLATPSAQAIHVATELDRRSGRGALPFKGALGRASRNLVFPDARAGIAVAPDAICVGRGHVAQVAVPAGKDDLVAVILHPTRAASGRDGAPVYARIFADDKLCDAITEAVGAGTGTSGAHALATGVRVLSGCRNDDVRFVTANLGSAVPYVLHLPILPLPPGDAAAVSANVRLAVFRASTLADVRTRMQRLADPAQKCADVCGDADSMAGLDVCIDDLYETLPGPTATASTLFVRDSIGCNIAIPQDIQCDANDFQDLCTGPNTDPALAPCNHSVADLQFWQSNCGAVHFPFTYAGIRRDTAGAVVDRILRGTTGTARKKNGDAVYLPGKEFVGATLCVAQCSDPPCSDAGDWRLPDLDVWYKDGSNAVAGLTGVADKDASVVDVVPALKTVLLCDVAGEEACTGVDYQLGTRRVVCACRDRYPANCKCKDASPPKYFECTAPSGYAGTYAYAGLPCTRHAHCPDGGYCKASPKCRPPGQRIWGDSGTMTGTDCQDDSACPPGNVCGFRLFDFSYLIDSQTPAVGKVHEKITGSGATIDRRGYCKNDVKKGCKQSADCPNNQECFGYDLEAEGKP